METKLPNDFKELLRSLNANGVRYLLIGGFAVSFHGYPRSTNDLDLFIAKDLENAGRLVDCLTDFGFSTNDLSTDLFTQDKSVVQMGVEPVQIEIVNFISGIDFEEAYKNRITAMIDDVEASIISLEDLRINKKASGRFKDLDDLEHLP